MAASPLRAVTKGKSCLGKKNSIKMFCNGGNDTLELIIDNLTFVVSKHCVIMSYGTAKRLREGNVKYLHDYVACSEAF